MKKATNLFYLAVLIIQLAIKPVEAQPLNFGEGWMVGISGGALTYFGTISSFKSGESLAQSFNKDSEFGMSYMFGKMVTRTFSLKAVYLNGKMKGVNNDLAFRFTNNLDEIGLYADLSLIKLFQPRYNGRLNPYVNIGGGFLQVDSYRNRIPDDIINDIAVSESAVFLTTGLGVKYDINLNWKVDLYGGFRATDSDLIDSTLSDNGINDMYSFISIGIVYILIPPAYTKTSRGMPCPDW
jgi:opacity protein-like surface antigen